MPFSHEVNADAGFGVIRLSGTVTGAELLDALAWFYAAADWAPGSRVLWDGRGIDHFAVSPEDSDKAADLVEGAVGRLAMTRTAVVTKNLDAYMSGSLLASRLGRRTGREARAFTELLTALEWLAAPSSPLADDVLEFGALDGASAVGGDGAPLEHAAPPSGALR